MSKTNCGTVRGRFRINFGKPYKPQENIDEALAPSGAGRVFCGKPIALRDVIEEKFESPEVKAVRQIAFEGEPFGALSVQNWRKKLLG